MVSIVAGTTEGGRPYKRFVDKAWKTVYHDCTIKNMLRFCLAKVMNYAGQDVRVYAETHLPSIVKRSKVARRFACRPHLCFASPGAFFCCSTCTSL